MITVNLTIKNSSTGTISPLVCNSYTSPSGKYSWTASGTHKDTILNSKGCDSLITINLTIKNSSTSTISPVVCNSYTSPSGKYSWTASGIHKDTIANSRGCDSLITINLTIKNSTTSTINPITCNNSYTSPSGKYSWTASGIHKDTIANSRGCDSLITINLTIKNSSTSTISPVACNSYTSPSGKYSWTASGIHKDTILNSRGCDSLMTINLTINPLPVVGTTIGAATTIGAGTSVTLAGTGAVNYIWSGGVTNGVAFTPTITATYTVTGIDANTCSNKDTAKVTVNPLPNITVSVSGTTITANQSGAVYQWLNCTNVCSPVAGATNQSFTPSSTGSYKVVISLNGVTDTSAMVNITVTGIKEISNGNAISIYPNPFTFQTTISFAEEQVNTTIKIIDVLGKEITTINFTGTQCVIEKGGMNSGVYFVQITDAKNTITNKRIIIQ